MAIQNILYLRNIVILILKKKDSTLILFISDVLHVIIIYNIECNK